MIAVMESKLTHSGTPSPDCKTEPGLLSRHASCHLGKENFYSIDCLLFLMTQMDPMGIPL